MTAKVTFTSPEAVEEAFYRALEGKDRAALRYVWGTDAMSIQPYGPPLLGEAIDRRFVQLFESDAPLKFQRQLVKQWGGADWRMHLLCVHLLIEPPPTQPLLAIHLYQRGRQGWRLSLQQAAVGLAPES